MDLLKREMERKKKALMEAKQKAAAATASTGGNDGDDDKTRGRPNSHKSRYVKTTELRRYLEEGEAEAAAAVVTARNVAANLNENDKEGAGAATGAQHKMGQPQKGEAGISSAATTRSNQTNSADNKAVSERPPKKRKTESNALESKANSDDEMSPPVQSSQDEENSTADSAMQQKQETEHLKKIFGELRLLGEPITLFGESSLSQRRVRLQHAQSQQAAAQLNETEADEFRLGQGHGIRNPFLERETSTTERTDTTGAMTSSNNTATDQAMAHNASDEDDERHDGNNRKAASDNDNDPHKRIYRHFKGLLRQWEADVNNRPDDVKRSLAGRNERKTVKQCKDYIRPLFTLCKRRQLEDGLLQKLVQMVQFCEQGEFVKAHDAYMDVAIGRAAWPIGVTMVGIHARSGRAKIESSNVAHVMNSELQRKYLTSVKRLLTYEQSKRTDVDPSKKVLH